MRTPQTIAAEARAHLDNANKAFVPANLLKLAEMSVEFMESTVAALDAVGALPAEPVDETPAG